MQRDIEDFCRHLVLERGLSAHTAEAYAVDAGHLLDFAAEREPRRRRNQGGGPSPVALHPA